MLELTFGEQVKIVLNRKDMTIKQLAEMIEERTGKKNVQTESDAETGQR